MSDLKCVHCGLDCGNKPVWQNENPFCCEGCKTVYNILQHGKLKKYYSLMETPGIRLEAPEEGGKYAWLDREEIIQKLLEYRQGNVSRVRLFIPSIHCSSCIWLLENLSRLRAGIIHSEVNFPAREITVTFKHDMISLRQLAELLASIHYLPEINPDIDKSEAKQKEGNRLLRQLGVAGFCFANIMLLSLPDYFTVGYRLDYEYRLVFGIINFLLIIPVILFSGVDYLLSGFRNLRKGIINIDLPISIGISALLFQSIFVLASDTGPGYFDSLAGFVFFLLIGKWFQQHTYDALSFERDYKSFFPVGVLRIEPDGKESNVLLDELKMGDRVRIRSQEIIPADGHLVSDKAHIDYSFVSGESEIVECVRGEEVFAGGRQKGSSIDIELSAAVEQSRLTRLWNHDLQSKKKDKSLKMLIDQVSKYFTLVVILIALVSLGYWWIFNSSLALLSFVSVLIVACPCALALTLPFTYGNAMRQMGIVGFFLKHSGVVEVLSSADTIVFDKTGTLTEQGNFQVIYFGKTLSEDEKMLLRSSFRHSTHPLSRAVSDFLGEGKSVEPEFFQELPSLGIFMKYKDTWIKAGSESFVRNEKSDIEPGSKVYISTSFGTNSYFQVISQLRNGLDEVFQNIKEKYDIHLLSGDGPADASRMGNFFRKENMHFGMLPADKHTYIQKLKQQGKKVIMIGDGLNDAGALAASNAGISVAGSVYHFSPACDAIMKASQFEKIPGILGFARQSKIIIHLSFLFSVLYNIAGLWFAVQGLLTPVIAAILMPLSSLTIVVFTTFTTRWLGIRWLNVN
ncbi:MAG: heavy metal translocating P-type ATPase metal-binding domain-containing protein [Bacteroidales bacterium]|nr:heavy metal translocating P-type ATPase metal-binding domain-containing protein [Bacteroidales bacterium]